MSGGNGVGNGSTWQGRRFEKLDAHELRRCLDAAFDYRGDVTVVLADGTPLTGYVFSHDALAPEPCIKMYPTDRSDRVTVRTRDIAAIVFSGDDKAAGKSWQAWVERYEEKQRRLAQDLPTDDVEPRVETLD